MNKQKSRQAIISTAPAKSQAPGNLSLGRKQRLKRRLETTGLSGPLLLHGVNRAKENSDFGSMERYSQYKEKQCTLLTRDKFSKQGTQGFNEVRANQRPIRNRK